MGQHERAAHTEPRDVACPQAGDGTSVKPRVSIVVPAFNNAEYIEETLRSIVSQTYDNLEIIVADHGSTDDTWQRLQQFSLDQRVTLLHTEAGGGARRNWNRVTAAATGEYVKLVCGDDIIAPTAVARQVAAFDEGVALVASARDIVDADLRPVIWNRGLDGLHGRHQGNQAVRRTVRAGTNIFGEPACVMMRRTALIAGGLWADEEYLIDQATYVQVLAYGDFVGIPDSLASFRVSASQWSVRLVRDQARQAVRFHKAVLGALPHVISRRDVALGNVRAHIAAWGRRGVYLWLGRRMIRGTQ